MTTPSHSDPGSGWGDSLPLPLTPQACSPAPRGDVPQASQRAHDRETGGPKGPEPTRYNDWEQKGRCSDF